MKIKRSDKECWLLELTSFSSAGLYASNKKDIVEKVSAIAERDWKQWRNVNGYEKRATGFPSA